MKPLASNAQNKEMQNALKALQRASDRAKKLAAQTGTAFIVMRDGKLIREIPKPDSRQNQSLKS